MNEKKLNIAFYTGILVSVVAWVIMVVRAERMAEMASSVWPLVTGTLLATFSLYAYIKALKAARDDALSGNNVLNLKKPALFVFTALASSAFAVWYAYYLGLTTT